MKYRLLKQADFKQIVYMVMDIWQLDQMCGGIDEGLVFSKIYVFKKATHAYVVIDEEKVIGLLVLSVLGKKKSDIVKKYEDFLGSVSDSEYQGMMNEYKQNCEWMLKKSGLAYDGEIVLLVVSRDYQGQGVGRFLMDLAKKVFQHEGCHGYYLYTDTSCHYQFYDHIGMERVFSLKRESDGFELYLYGGQ